MLALSLDAAKNLAIVAVLVFITLSIVSALVVKSIVTKLIMIGVLAGLALLVWSQRASLQECADKVSDREALGDTSELTCTLFGAEISLP